MGLPGCGAMSRGANAYPPPPPHQPTVPCPPHAAGHRDVPLSGTIASRGPPGAQSHRQQRLQKQVGAGGGGPHPTLPAALTPFSLPSPPQHGGGGLRRGVRPGDVRQPKAHQQRVHDLRGAGPGGPTLHPAHGGTRTGGKDGPGWLLPATVARDPRESHLALNGSWIHGKTNAVLR